MNRYDLISLTVGVLILCASLGLIYGAFWWYAEYVTPMMGLTLNQVLEEPLLDIIFMVASFWVIPGLFIMGLGMILGLMKAVLE